MYLYINHYTVIMNNSLNSRLLSIEERIFHLRTYMVEVLKEINCLLYNREGFKSPGYAALKLRYSALTTAMVSLKKKKLEISRTNQGFNPAPEAPSQDIQQAPQA
jgi:hypothetical protein